jgi:hypothetical protein
MATASGSLPAIDSVGQRQRKTARLANFGWWSGVVSFFLTVGISVPAGFVALGDTRQLEHDLPWLFVLVYGLLLVGFALGIVAVVIGILVLLRTRRGAEIASRNTAILGMFVGGAIPVFTLVMFTLMSLGAP